MHLEGNIPGRGHARVEIGDGRIRRVVDLGPAQEGAPYLAPGFVDLQLNGFAGVDFSDAALEVEQVLSVLEPLRQTGAAAFCPTLVTNSRELLERNFAVLEKARQADARAARAIPCYHLEGPYITRGESRGVHNPEFIRHPDWDEFCALQQAAGGNIGIVTLAPEVPGALDFIRRASQAGVVVALGHTDASAACIHQAAEAGARLSTHLGNGIYQHIHRHDNPIWAQLADDRLAASIICDGFHLPADLVRVITRSKGLGRVILVSDAIHVAMRAPGRYLLAGIEVELLASGKVAKAGSWSLAGSALRMDRAVHVFLRDSGASLEDAVAAASTNPAALIGRGNLCRRIEPGQPASLTVFRLGAGQLEVVPSL